MTKSKGKSIHAAPHDIENPYTQLRDRMTEEFELDKPKPEPSKQSPTHPLRCIFRVPHRLRCEHEKAVHYTPQVISIGPLHHENPALKVMEVHKKRYLQYFMNRPNNPPLMHCIQKIKDQEDKLRSCYSETIVHGSDEFVKIILVDAIFIIEFLLRHRYPTLQDEDDYIFGKPLMKNDIWPDLLMLENQLPFFILVDLFNLAIFPAHSNKLEGVEGLSILFLSQYFLNDVPFGGRPFDLKTICSSKVEHFVDLLRKLCIAPIKEQNGTDEVESDISEDGLVGVAMPLGTDDVIGAAMPLGTDVCDPIQLLSTDVVRGSMPRDDVQGGAMPLDTNLGCAMSLGTDVREPIQLLPTNVVGADEVESDISKDMLLLRLNGGCARPLGTDVRDPIQLLPTDVVGADMSLGTHEIGASVSQSLNELQGAVARQSKYITAPSIEELHLAGIEFKVGSTKNLFDIQFKDGILEIPKLKTEDRTELILRNLVAFEQCAFITQTKNTNESAFECYISDYVGIMDQFVDTLKDVELLVKSKIVENYLGGGDEALSTMINSVSTGVIYHPTDMAYDTLRKDLNTFCGSCCNKNMANLRQNYFNTPWATISFFAAVILLILTVVQTICSIISLS